MPKGALIAGSGTHRTPGLRSHVGAPDPALGNGHNVRSALVTAHPL